MLLGQPYFYYTKHVISSRNQAPSISSWPVSCKRLQKIHTGTSSYRSDFVPVSCKYPLRSLHMLLLIYKSIYNVCNVYKIVRLVAQKPRLLTGSYCDSIVELIQIQFRLPYDFQLSFRLVVAKQLFHCRSSIDPGHNCFLTMY